MLSGGLASLHATEWLLLVRIQRTYNMWVRSPWRSFAHKAGGKGDICDHQNAATPLCWKSDQDASMIADVSEIYRTAVISVFSVQDSISVPWRFCPSCDISQKLCTFAILHNLLYFVSIFRSESFSVFIIYDAWLSSEIFALLAPGNWLTTSFLCRLSPAVFDCSLPIPSCHSEKLASSPTPCGLIDNMLHGTLERSEYSQCISSHWRHQSVMSGIRYVLLITIGLECYTLILWLIRLKFFVAPGGHFKFSPAVVIQHAAWSLLLGVLSSISFSIK